MGYHSALKKREGDSSICDKMGKTWGHYAKWNKPVKERQIFHDSIYRFIESKSRMMVFRGWKKWGNESH